MYSDTVLDEVRRGNDIVDVISSYVRLDRRGGGGRLWGLCPFHREKTPSFTVRADMQTFHCFGCGTGGNVFTFIMRYENLGFVDAVKRLAERARVELPEDKNVDNYIVGLKEKIYEANAAAAKFFFGKLKGGEGVEARRYLTARRLAPAIVTKFGLGFSPTGWDELLLHLRTLGFEDDVLIKAGLVGINKKGGLIDKFRGRLMFPIIDEAGRVCGFGGRNMLDGDFGPKYLNTQETPVFSKNRNLFALNFARKSKLSNVIVVEGYMDALALFQAGFDATVATLGTAMGMEHARLFNRFFRGKTLVLLFDSDAAGEAASLRAVPILRRENVNVKVLRLAKAKDPDEFLVKYGRDAFEGALESAKHPTAWQLEVCKQNAESTGEDETREIAYVNAAIGVLAELDDPVEQETYINKLSEETKIRAETIQSRVERAMGGGDYVMPLLPGRNVRQKTNLTEQVMYAYRTVLFYAASKPHLRALISQHLAADEIRHIVYGELYAKILSKNDIMVQGAELITAFDDVENQAAVAVVFEKSGALLDDNGTNEELNKQIKIIKHFALQEDIKDAIEKFDSKLIQTLKNRQNTLPDLYI